MVEVIQFLPLLQATKNSPISTFRNYEYKRYLCSIQRTDRRKYDIFELSIDKIVVFVTILSFLKICTYLDSALTCYNFSLFVLMKNLGPWWVSNLHPLDMKFLLLCYLHSELNLPLNQILISSLIFMLPNTARVMEQNLN